MTIKKYSIHYPDDLSDANFSSMAAMRKYLESEAEAYSGFLNLLETHPLLSAVQGYDGGTVSGEQIANSFQQLIDSLGDPEIFESKQDHKSYHGIALPPPSISLEGRLLLGLVSNQRSTEALSVFLWFAARQMAISANGKGQIARSVKYGEELVTAAFAAEALPFRNETSQRLAGAMRRAENQSEALNEEVEAAQKINSAHEKELEICRENISTRAKRIERIFLNRERRHRRQFLDDLSEFELDRDEAFKEFRVHQMMAKRANDEQLTNYEAEFHRLKDLFYSQLRLRAPVKLWEGRSKEHAKNARRALIAFCSVALIAIFAAAIVPWAYGDYIAQSFVAVSCSPVDPADCTRGFSAKGPLTIAGLLLVMSLVLWVIRLQYRIYLSERHLSLDAEEKRAFSEAYLAMTEGKTAGADNEAIVFAALFRPTQDGIIKDDDSSVDLSAAALLAKQLSRSQ